MRPFIKSGSFLRAPFIGVGALNVGDTWFCVWYDPWPLLSSMYLTQSGYGSNWKVICNTSCFVIMSHKTCFQYVFLETFFRTFSWECFLNKYMPYKMGRWFLFYLFHHHFWIAIWKSGQFTDLKLRQVFLNFFFLSLKGD